MPMPTDRQRLSFRQRGVAGLLEEDWEAETDPLHPSLFEKVFLEPGYPPC
jgi:hypothetical protein